MAKALHILPLEELYDRPKMTPAVIKYIAMKEDFSKIQPTYCEKVCLIPSGCKSYHSENIRTDQVDVLVAYPHKSPNERSKYGRDIEGSSIDKKFKDIARFLTNRAGLGKYALDSTYALRCRPDGKKVKLTHAKRCVPYLLEEIALRKPKVVLGLGTDIGKALGLPKCKRGVAYEMEHNGHRFILICTIHVKTLVMIRQNASGQFWGPDYMTVLERDMSKVEDILSGRVKVIPLQDAIQAVREKYIYVAKSIDEIKKFYQYLQSAARLNPNKEVVVSWDTETTGLDPWAPDAKFLCHQFAFRHITTGDVRSFVIPLFHRDNDRYDPQEAWEIVSSILTNKMIVKVPHNGSFDLIYTRVVGGIEVQRVEFDTMLLFHSLNSGIQGQYDLKTSTTDLLFEWQLGGYDDMLQLDDLEDDEETEDGTDSREAESV